ncbi:flavin-containing monooxygenase [Arenimonas sp. MALMAid1274]|uniref:flavin-containing monooxygenase n=1 Tax=Arenimonas sp. MALMAid1274 TaxID=3411630 RepID=UPI003B9E94F2
MRPWPDPSRVNGEPLDVLIVGAGFSGLCLAIRLREAGLRFKVLEQADRVGGTWRDNVYPGAACDVPSDLYCFSFAPRPDNSRRYPGQAELQAYLEHCADRFGVRDHLRLGCTVREARFDPVAFHWRVRVDGDEREWLARSLVIATGGLSRPRWPDIPGLTEFRGERVHSARWRPLPDGPGIRIGVIGTGASAIQIVPSLARGQVELAVFQRTPAWVLPKRDPRVPAWRQRAYRRWPWLQKAARGVLRVALETRGLAFTRAPWLLRAARPVFEFFLRRQVHDPVLRAALRPDYVPGCKRVLLSNDYLAAFDRGRATLVTSPIRRVVAEGIETADGVLHRLDAIVACTGFEAAEAGVPFPVHGREGRELNAQWREGAQAYRGTQVSGFPNLFLMTGPNTGLGHTSVLLMIEAQAAFILRRLHALAGRVGQAMDVRAAAQADYNAWLQRRLAGTVWNTGGCRSWYLTGAGLNTTLWPGTTPAFERLLRRPDPQAIEFIGPEKKVPPP